MLEYLLAYCCFVFNIHFIYIDYKVIKLKASSQSEALKWIQSIEDAIAKFKSQYFLTHD